MSKKKNNNIYKKLIDEFKLYKHSHSKDFSRKRKLPFVNVFLLIFRKSVKSLQVMSLFYIQERIIRLRPVHLLKQGKSILRF